MIIDIPKIFVSDNVCQYNSVRCLYSINDDVFINLMSRVSNVDILSEKECIDLMKNLYIDLDNSENEETKSVVKMMMYIIEGFEKNEIDVVKYTNPNFSAILFDDNMEYSWDEYGVLVGYSRSNTPNRTPALDAQYVLNGIVQSLLLSNWRVTFSSIRILTYTIILMNLLQHCTILENQINTKESADNDLCFYLFHYTIHTVMIDIWRAFASVESKIQWSQIASNHIKKLYALESPSDRLDLIKTFKMDEFTKLLQHRDLRKLLFVPTLEHEGIKYYDSSLCMAQFIKNEEVTEFFQALSPANNLNDLEQATLILNNKMKDLKNTQ